MGKKTKKFASVLMSVSVAGWIAGTSALVPFVAVADHTTAHTIEQLQAQIASLQATLLALAGGSGGGGSAMCSFTRDLTLGSKGDDVTCLQNSLKSTGHFTYAGGATGYFGGITKSAVSAWQAANGVSPTAGYFGAISRAKYSSMAGGPAPVPVPGPGPLPVPAPSGTLAVSAGTHPSASLFPESAARVPFTVVRFTAPSTGDVTVNSIVVERTGLAQDAAIDGVVLLDENGTQLGLSKTLNSAHQANLNDPVVVKAGMTRTLTIGANAPASLDSYAGQVAYFSVVSVSASLPVAGSLPITGAGHTVNGSLTIGTITVARGSTDPGAAATKRLDATAYTFSAVRVTSGSAERMYLKSVRWNQIGSAGASDLANVKSIVDGTVYDVVVSADGKYYTAVFGDNAGKGLLIDKGFSKEISVKGDIVGGTSRTVAFDLAKRTDINVVGETYGYGVIAPQTNSCAAATGVSCFTSTEDPWYDGATVTIGVGTILVSSSNKAPAQNIAINLANQPLGAFEVTVKGESISVSRIGFNLTMTSEDGDSDIDDVTNITITNESGAVVAGPADGSASDSSNTTGSGDGSVVFTDTITFPVGTTIYYLKGKIGTEIANNTQVQASTTPSTDFAGTVRGTVSGTSITPDPASALTLSQMTVKAGALTISVSTVPIAQTVIAGIKGFLFANYVLNAGDSGEDVRMVGLPVEFNMPTSFSHISNCALYDGSTIVSSTVNPTGAASSTNVTLSGGGLTIPKGTAKTLGLKCDVGSGATGNVRFGYNDVSNPSPTGITSGQDITETESGNVSTTSSGTTGQRMTFATGGSLSVVIDPSSPAYKLVTAGTAGVELNRIKFSAANEDIDLRQMALQMRGTASNTPEDLVGNKVTLWDGATQIGEALIFARDTGDFATSTAISNVRIPKDGAKVITVKGDISVISNSGPRINSGNLLIVEYDGGNVGLTGNYGVGVDSGTNVSPSGSDTSSSGVRILKAYPELAYVPLTSTQRALAGGTTADKTLYRFSVKAVGGDVALYKMSFELGSSTHTATTSLYSVYAYTDSGFTLLDSAFSATGIVNAGQCYSNGTTAVANTIGLAGTQVEIYPDKTGCNDATTTYIVPSGVTRYFDFRATVSTVESLSSITESFTARMAGDAAFPTAFQTGGSTVGEMGKAGTLIDATAELGVDNDTNDDFIWSPVSTTTNNTVSDLDFINGYNITGLPAVGMTQETLTSN